MSRTVRETVTDYLTALEQGDLDVALGLVADDAVFDVTRGRLEGVAIRAFHERLQRIHSTTRLASFEERGPRNARAVFEQSDDDLVPLGVDAIRLDVEVETDPDGRIRKFKARPTEASRARIDAARKAGRTSAGVELAERAGTLPPRH